MWRVRGKNNDGDDRRREFVDGITIVSPWNVRRARVLRRSQVVINTRGRCLSRFTRLTSSVFWTQTYFVRWPVGAWDNYRLVHGRARINHPRERVADGSIVGGPRGVGSQPMHITYARVIISLTRPLFCGRRARAPKGRPTKGSHGNDIHIVIVIIFNSRRGFSRTDRVGSRATSTWTRRVRGDFLSVVTHPPPLTSPVSFTQIARNSDVHITMPT